MPSDSLLLSFLCIIYKVAVFIIFASYQLSFSMWSLSRCCLHSCCLSQHAVSFPSPTFHHVNWLFLEDCSISYFCHHSMSFLPPIAPFGFTEPLSVAFCSVIAILYNLGSTVNTVPNFNLVHKISSSHLNLSFMHILHIHICMSR